MKNNIRADQDWKQRSINMVVVYIAGPYRADTAWDRECNIHRARTLGVEVAKLGVCPLIPHANTAHFDGVMPDEFWLLSTMELLRRSDALITCEGWYHSSGTRAEIAEMNDLKRPVFHSLVDLQAWLRGEPRCTE